MMKLPAAARSGGVACAATDIWTRAKRYDPGMSILPMPSADHHCLSEIEYLLTFQAGEQDG